MPPHAFLEHLERILYELLRQRAISRLLRLGRLIQATNCDDLRSPRVVGVERPVFFLEKFLLNIPDARRGIGIGGEVRFHHPMEHDDSANCHVNNSVSLEVKFLWEEDGKSKANGEASVTSPSVDRRPVQGQGSWERATAPHQCFGNRGDPGQKGM